MRDKGGEKVDYVIEEIKKKKIIAILRGFDQDENFFIMDNLINSGISIFEISLTTKNAINIIKEAINKYGDTVLIGAGTVMSLDDAEEVIKAGAKFILAPNFSKEIVEYSQKNNMTIIPGVFTPSEMADAYELGCTLVKLFPASTVGSDYIKSVKSPMPFLNIMAVGGIDYNNMLEFLNAGACAVGVGSSLTPRKYIKDRNKKDFQEHLKKYINQI